MLNGSGHETMCSYGIGYQLLCCSGIHCIKIVSKWQPNAVTIDLPTLCRSFFVKWKGIPDDQRVILMPWMALNCCYFIEQEILLSLHCYSVATQKTRQKIIAHDVSSVKSRDT